MNEATQDTGQPAAPEKEKTRRQRREAWIDHALEETFPASDPPSWMPGGAEPSRHYLEPEPRDREPRSEAPGPSRSTVPAAAEPVDDPPGPAIPEHREPEESHDRHGPGRAFRELGPEERERNLLPHRQTQDTELASGEGGAGTDMSGRREAGQGPHESMPGTPHSPEHRHHAGAAGVQPFGQWTRKALYERARQQGILGRSKMTKAQLIDVLRNMRNT